MSVVVCWRDVSNAVFTLWSRHYHCIWWIRGRPTIKDNTHQRRGRNVHHVVSFTAQTEISGKKEELLSRYTNKQRLVQMISDQLRERDCIVVNAHGDADVDIVKTAVETSLQHTTTLIGDDTDLLVLLLYYPQGEVMNLYFRSDKLQSGWHYWSVSHQSYSRGTRAWNVFPVDVHPCHDWFWHDIADFRCRQEDSFQIPSERRPCPSVLCHRIHNSEPDNRAYR